MSYEILLFCFLVVRFKTASKNVFFLLDRSRRTIAKHVILMVFVFSNESNVHLKPSHVGLLTKG